MRRINNYLREDRYTPTKFKGEYSSLSISEDKVYSNKDIDIVRNGIPDGIPSGIPNTKIDKPQKKTNRFVPPTVDEVRAYCIERDNEVDAERFIDFYESKGWYVGKNPMKNWKAAVRTWEKPKNGRGMSEIDRKQRASYTEESNPFT